MRVSARIATVVAIALMSPGAAWGQPADDVARADALFNTAKQLRDAGQPADACPKFAESKQLAPGVGVSLYLADCYERIGKTASAWTEFRSAEQLARQRNDKRADVAHARSQGLEPKLSGLTIAVPPSAGREPPEILLDGARVPPEEWNAAMAVDPGDHVITINAAGRAPQTVTAHVDPGNRHAIVRVEEAGAGAVAAPAPDVATPAEATPSSASSDPGATHRGLGIALLGVGAVGVGLGTTFLLNRPTASAPSCTPTTQDDTATTGAIIAFAAGGAALVTAVVLLVTAPHKTNSGLVVAPTPLANGGGAMLRASF
jgi:hypothetical protein